MYRREPEEKSMSRDQMRNLEAFKIGSTQVNEFEYQKNQGQMTEQAGAHPDEALTEKQPTRAERVKQIMSEAHKKVEKKRKQAIAKAGGKAKKLASKTARKTTTRKSTSAKSAGKKAKKARKK